MFHHWAQEEQAKGKGRESRNSSTPRSSPYRGSPGQLATRSKTNSKTPDWYLALREPISHFLWLMTGLPGCHRPTGLHLLLLPSVPQPASSIVRRILNTLHSLLCQQVTQFTVSWGRQQVNFRGICWSFTFRKWLRHQLWHQPPPRAVVFHSVFWQQTMNQRCLFPCTGSTALGHAPLAYNLFEEL